MNYSELKASHDELHQAICRHNEQAQNMVNKAAFEDPEETVRAFENMPDPDPNRARDLQKAIAIITAIAQRNDPDSKLTPQSKAVLDAVYQGMMASTRFSTGIVLQLEQKMESQRNIIEQAREALRLGDYAGAGRILDSWK